MFRKFLMLQWKSFFRASSFAGNMVIKIIMILGALYFSLCFLALGAGLYFILDKSGQDPLVVVNKFIIYYFVADLIVRLLLQKIPVINIRPLLGLPIKRGTIVNFALAKTGVSFFNILHAFLFVPFSIVLITKGYDPLHVVLWHIAILALIYCNNFLNILLNDKDSLFVVFLVLVGAFGALQYYGLFDITGVTAPFYQSLYDTVYMFVTPLVVLAVLWMITYRYFYKRLYLDTGLKGKNEVAETTDYSWLNRFGTLGTFLKNDIKLIKRNKRSRNTLFASFFFLFYGLLFFSNSIEIYQNSPMQVFAGIFVTGGFMFFFGQFVPSWDSAYYPLMMSQNIQYREYISSKWWLVTIGTVISTLLASFYLYFGIDAYLIILSGAIYNIGINSHMVLLGGAFLKTPVDLAAGRQAFGNKKAVNKEGFLLVLPKLVLPVVLFYLGKTFINVTAGYAFVAGAGLLGLAFKNKVFTLIEKIYKSEKYKTIVAYAQKN